MHRYILAKPQTGPKMQDKFTAVRCATNSEANIVERNPTMAQIMDALAGAKRVADIGCGAGALSDALVKRGFDVVGLDPQEDLIALARKRVPNANFFAARAEAMPLPEGDVDAAVILNALHHIPQAALDDALKDTLRILRPGGVLVIVEPLAEGSFFKAMQPVNDETVVRAHALDALARLIGEAPEHLERHERYELPIHFDDPESFLEYLHKAEPARAKDIRAQHETVMQALEDHATQDENGFTLVTPMSIWVFRIP